MHTDASLSGLGVMIKTACGPPMYFSATVPQNFARNIDDSQNIIYLLEIYGALLGVKCLRKAARGQVINVLMFVDNNAALASILRGYSSGNLLATRIIFEFWREQSEAGCPVWLERVRSSWNEADAPSRGLLPRGAKCVRVEFPIFDTPF